MIYARRERMHKKFKGHYIRVTEQGSNSFDRPGYWSDIDGGETESGELYVDYVSSNASPLRIISKLLTWPDSSSGYQGTVVRSLLSGYFFLSDSSSSYMGR